MPEHGAEQHQIAILSSICHNGRMMTRIARRVMILTLMAVTVITLSITAQPVSARPAGVWVTTTIDDWRHTISGIAEHVCRQAPVSVATMDRIRKDNHLSPTTELLVPGLHILVTYKACRAGSPMPVRRVR